MALSADKYITVSYNKKMMSNAYSTLFSKLIDPPKYFAGNIIAFSCMAMQTLLVILLRILLARENSRRCFLSEVQKQQEIEKYGGDELVGDRHPSFRYVL